MVAEGLFSAGHPTGPMILKNNDLSYKHYMKTSTIAWIDAHDAIKCHSWPAGSLVFGPEWCLYAPTCVIVVQCTEKKLVSNSDILLNKALQSKFFFFNLIFSTCWMNLNLRRNTFIKSIFHTHKKQHHQNHTKNNPIPSAIHYSTLLVTFELHSERMYVLLCLARAYDISIRH